MYSRFVRIEYSLNRISKIEIEVRDYLDVALDHTMIPVIRPESRRVNWITFQWYELSFNWEDVYEEAIILFNSWKERRERATLEELLTGEEGHNKGAKAD